MDYREIGHGVSSDNNLVPHPRANSQAHISNKEELKSERHLLGNVFSRKERAVRDIYMEYCALHGDILSQKVMEMKTQLSVPPTGALICHSTDSSAPPSSQSLITNKPGCGLGVGRSLIRLVTRRATSTCWQAV